MQGKHASKMSLGFAFALLLTLQSLQLVSTQSSNLENGDVTPSPVNGIPNERNKEYNSISPDISSGSMTFSGDGESQDGNQTVRAATGQYVDNANTTSSPQTTLNVSSNPTTTNATSIPQNNTSNPVTPNPNLGPSVTNGSHVNLAENDTTTSSPGTSTTINTASTTSTPAFNITQSSTSTVSGNFSTTSPPQVENYTKSPSENSTNTTASTTTIMYNHTSVVLINDSSNASTTTLNATGVSLDSRGSMDRGLSPDIQQQTKSQAWGAILGIGVGVAIIALVILIIVKRRNYRDFSHRKLVEDMPSDPVLQLDNSEPLDLKFDGFAYYNPGLQRDNIQMTNFPHGHTN
ncbi:mucin-15 [Ictalurus furcatus]|uniref:mucin-15 n=1 Tax=Ictalurus furcatus TaxID=66913 RepID=UPI002350DE16|nr:mucin-15 [Ictalurus furcatus]